MKRTYRIAGMHCAACEQAVRKALLLEPDVLGAVVNAGNGTAQVDLLRDLPVERLRALVGRTGSYSLADEVSAPDGTAEPSATGSQTYFPLVLIAIFITGVALLAQWPLRSVDGMLWMKHFMAGFFLVFSFFKLLDIRGFATSFAMYDPIARRFPAWGVVYPFVELALGVLYLTGTLPVFTAWATILVMGIGAIGPIESVLNKRRIRCACLGAVFNLPMSTVTIVEDLLMVGMAAVMLVAS